jgi:cobalt/nickel transport system permease protein
VFDEPFAHGRSPVHGLDPRVRLAMAALFSVCVALLQGTLPAAAAALALAATILVLSAPPMRPLCKRVALVNAFVAFSCG